MNSQHCETLRIVVLGDANVGRHSLLAVAARNDPALHSPRVALFMRLERQLVQLDVRIATSDEDMQVTRLLDCINADGIVYAFSLASRESFWHLLQLHVTETACFRLPSVLVGLQGDLACRVTSAEGICAAHHMNALRYVETSALTRQNCHLVFQSVAKAVLLARKEKSRGRRQFILE